jgi:hypothetical protein
MPYRKWAAAIIAFSSNPRRGTTLRTPTTTNQVKVGGGAYRDRRTFSRLIRRCAFLIAIFQTSRRVPLHGFFLLLLLEGGWFGGWLRWLGSRLSWAPSRLARAIKEERPLGIAYETQRLMFQGTGEALTPHDLPHLRPQPQCGIVHDPSRLGWWLKQSFQHTPSLPRPNQMKVAHSFASVLRSSNQRKNTDAYRNGR